MKMMTTKNGVVRSMMLVSVAAVMIGGCGGEAQPDEVEAARLDTATQALNACQQACAQEQFACFKSCQGVPPTQDSDCQSDCAYDYWWCTAGSFSLQSQGKQICYMDKDIHATSIDIELYVADAYTDLTGCNEGTYYKRRVLTTVSCSPFSGEWSTSDCKKKVTSKITQLVSQGYIPIVSEPGVDACPTPRVP